MKLQPQIWRKEYSDRYLTLGLDEYSYNNNIYFRIVELEIDKWEKGSMIIYRISDHGFDYDHEIHK